MTYFSCRWNRREGTKTLSLSFIAPFSGNLYLSCYWILQVIHTNTNTSHFMEVKGKNTHTKRGQNRGKKRDGGKKRLRIQPTVLMQITSGKR